MEGALQPGAVLLGKYRVESVLGRGGMGVVLRVTHLHLGEELALKILLPDAAAGQDVHARFLREAQSAVRLRGEHVTRVSDVGMLPEGAPYIVMEYLRGADLAGELGRGMLPPGDIVDYMLQACEALAEAHALGIVHRDIKPSNLFVTYRPDRTPLVKVLDFGISKAPIAGPGLLTRTDTVMGTPGYMSPEQMKASKDVDARTDIWALGIVLYECLNGRRPFDAETFSAIVLRAATEPPPPMDPRIPRGLQAVVLRCLEKDRAARFQSMAELAAALAPFARDGRAAGIIVERASVMLRGQSGIVAPPIQFGRAPTATTLSGSAGMVHVRSRRRQYAIGGAVVLLGAIAVLSAASVRGASHSSVSAAEPSARDAGSANDRVAMQDRVDAASGTSLTVADQPSDASLTVAVTLPPVDAAVEHPPVSSDAEKSRQTAAHCQALEANKDWQKLRDCSSELAAFSVKDKGLKGQAEAFRVKAVRETANDVAADKVQRAIQDGNLREAQKQLSTIGSDSVYFATSDDAYRAAEAQAIEDNRRKAQGMANAHDCTGLKHFQVLVSNSSTSAVATAVAAVRCVERVASETPVDLVLRKNGANPVRQSNGSGSDTLRNPTQTPLNKNLTPNCNTMPPVEDIIGQAQNQFSAGFAKAALQLMTKALACKQDVRMYRMAAIYACVAQDRVSAKLYLAKLPAQFQTNILQRCQLEGIPLQ